MATTVPNAARGHCAWRCGARQGTGILMDISPSFFVVEKTSQMLDFPPCCVSLWSALVCQRKRQGGLIDGGFFLLQTGMNCRIGVYFG